MRPWDWPFSIGLVGDLCGNAPASPARPLEERAFLPLPRGQVDRALAALVPGVRMALDDPRGGDEPLGVVLRFRDLDDFSPERVIAQVPEVAEAVAQGASRDWCQHLINAILHHPSFQALEATWRGIAYLDGRLPDDATIQLKLLDVSRRQLDRDLASGDVRDTALLARLLDDPDGVPLSLWIADFAFSHHPEQIATLSQLAAVANEAKAPCLVAAAPELLECDSFQELAQLDQLHKLLESPKTIPWKSLRENPDSRWLAVCLPGLLARPPHEATTLGGFTYEEVPSDRYGDVQRLVHADYLWMNAAYGLAGVIAESQTRDGTPVAFINPSDPRRVGGLPRHVSLGDLGQPNVLAGPLGGRVSQALQHQSSDFGLCALSGEGPGDPILRAACSVHKPPTFHDVDVTASARAAATLPFVLATNRILWCVEELAWQWSQETRSAKALAERIQDWLAELIEPDLDAALSIRGPRPLVSAAVEVKPDLRHDGAEVLVTLCPWLPTGTPAHGVRSPMFVSGRFGP